MFKVVCVVDKEGTALDRLAKGVAKYHTNIEYVVLDVHPKRPSEEQVRRFEMEAKTADIIDWQYFRTAEMLRHLFPWLKEKKQILTHNNPYSIHESDWNTYDMNVGNNETIHKDLKEITQAPLEYVPITVDTDFWQYNPNWEKNGRILMVANRIESKKGILPVAIAAAEIDAKFVLVGNISDLDYMESIMQTGNVEFHENISDEKLRELYYGASILVCNSVDNFESGTMPILEAMLCGTPVVTRSVGHVPDLYNKKNMKLLNSDPDNVPYIRDTLQKLLFDTKQLEEMRRNAWDTARVRNFERRAYAYQKLYRKLQSPQRSVSIVMPICDKPDITRKSFEAICKQTYDNIELIICDDSPEPQRELINDLARFVSFPVRYMYTYKDDYGLGRARNLGIIEATGEIIVFCDQRMAMDRLAVEELVKQVKPSVWVFGDKDGKTTFVENFSAVLRSDIIKAGMFNERVDRYGGMSQEIRSRINRQGMTNQLVLSAKANPIGKSRNKWTKMNDIIKVKNMLWKVDL